MTFLDFQTEKNVEKQKPFASNSYCIICVIIYLDSVCHHVIFIMIPLTFLIILFCFALSPPTCFNILVALSMEPFNSQDLIVNFPL